MQARMQLSHSHSSSCHTVTLVLCSYSILVAFHVGSFHFVHLPFLGIKTYFWASTSSFLEKGYFFSRPLYNFVSSLCEIFSSSPYYNYNLLAHSTVFKIIEWDLLLPWKCKFLSNHISYTSNLCRSALSMASISISINLDSGLSFL